MKISIGCDHGGVELKDVVRAELEARGIEVSDYGAYDTNAVDYPDLARRVASDVSAGTSDMGVLVCKTGAGMSMAANKFPQVRATLCLSRHMAHLAREHNDSNILILGGDLLKEEECKGVLNEWVSTPFSGAERHVRRLNKVRDIAAGTDPLLSLQREDPDIFGAIRADEARQRECINLIASENYTSAAIREAQGSVMTNKYAEGYPRRRWYNGCGPVDQAEDLAIERAKAIFGAEHVNVQPHCGSGANMAAYFSVLKPGDKILAMSLDHGGHLTHGHKLNFSGRLFEIAAYGVDKESERIDYDALALQAEQEKPQMIVVGASAYSRIFDYARLREIADSVGAYLMADIAHVAGLVAAGVHPSPVPHCDFVTTTTHKTLRGPRGGMIMCKEAFKKGVDREVFPGTQGGPMMHTIAAKAVCFREAATDAFKAYQAQVIENAAVMAATLQQAGLRIVSGGTDNHLMLVDVAAIGVTGRDASEALQDAGIIVNKNSIPFDPNPPAVSSGIRIGTAAITTRGMGAEEAKNIAQAIAEVAREPSDDAAKASARKQMESLASRFPVP